MKKLPLLLVVSMILCLAIGTTATGQNQIKPPIRIPFPIIRFALLPDLEITEIFCSDSTGTVAFTVKNNGLGPLPTGWELELRPRAQVFLIEGGVDVLLGEVYLADATSWTAGGIHLPGGTSSYVTSVILEGSTTVKVVADSSDRVRERNESNNETMVYYRPCGRATAPDLEVVNLNVSSPDYALTPGWHLDQHIDVRIANRGRGLAKGTKDWPSDGYTIDFILSSDDVVPANATVVVTTWGAVFEKPLPSSYWYYQEDMLIGRIGQTDDLPREEEVGYMLALYLGGQVINLPREYPGLEWTTGSRLFYIVAIVDPLNKVDEVREDNNRFFFPVRIERHLGHGG